MVWDHQLYHTQFYSDTKVCRCQICAAATIAGTRLTLYQSRPSLVDKYAIMDTGVLGHGYHCTILNMFHLNPGRDLYSRM